MATLYTHKDQNIAKTWVLMALFFVVVMAIGWAVSYYFDNPGILVFAVMFALVMNVGSYWWSDKLVVAMAGAKPASETEFAKLHNLVENLAITAGLPKPRIYIIADPAPNAFATGRNATHAVVAVTTGLLGMLEHNELEGVIAHELSHIGNRDMLLSTVAVVLVGFVTLVSDFFLRNSLWGGRRDNGDGRANAILAIIAIALIVLAPIVAILLQLAISRKREFLADASGALLTRYPEGLANALRKIGAYQAPMRRANNATAHLYISNPFGPRAAMSGLAKLFMTHPPVEERIKALIGNR
ncbi:zinc metalloprotease HtpX [Candidatus Adlerbacteria bacterium RIFCSPLOWO2_01_FULL_51_16]|uniref:Protease HtpX homolog n=1 Tax=Candidatus Adlerbacteria bacterium RIFCSPLOWO2_01_FULL_51_16 TaxID=1797243 RepID=A0A1F4XGJ4_9BACT|nr:MAG: zinc metalloprotease HtpX [Candidatus Adlerbacteria bacterium RIFCSPLOWO2_01_FULL_51_16]